MATKSRGLKLKHINHVVYLVRDLKRSMEFYNRFLGIKQIPSQVDNPNIVWLQLPSGVMLHLIETKSAPCPEESHVAFEVEDFAGALEAVKAKGLEITRNGVRKDGQQFLFTKDPDGNRVELCTPSGF